MENLPLNLSFHQQRRSFTKRQSASCDKPLFAPPLSSSSISIDSFFSLPEENQRCKLAALTETRCNFFLAHVPSIPPRPIITGPRRSREDRLSLHRPRPRLGLSLSTLHTHPLALTERALLSVLFLPFPLPLPLSRCSSYLPRHPKIVAGAHPQRPAGRLLTTRPRHSSYSLLTTSLGP